VLAVALVVAESIEAAAEGAALVGVRYQASPAAVDFAAEQAHAIPQKNTKAQVGSAKKGDAEAALAVLRWLIAAAGQTGAMTASCSSSVFAGFRFPREVIAVAVRWYLRYGLSYRDVEELLAERGVIVDHVTIYRWVQRFTPEFIEAARPCRHVPGDRWFADETYVKVAGRWTYLYRAIDQFGQVIDVLLSRRRDLAAARRFLHPRTARGHDPGRGHHRPGPGLPAGTGGADPLGAAHHPALCEQPGRSRSRTAESAAAADARTEASPFRADPGRRSFVQNLRRGHYELATDVPAGHRIQAAFDQLAMVI
jgi:transposase, IS6 family